MIENSPSTIVKRKESQSKENYETITHIPQCFVKYVLYCVRDALFRQQEMGES